MLTVMILASLSLSTDDPPKPKTRPAAMVLDLQGKVEIRPAVGGTKLAEPGDLLYPGERLAAPADGTATLSILGAGARETIKPGTEATVGPKGCSPPESVAVRKVQTRAVASTMRNIRPAPGDGRKAGVGIRGGPEAPPAVTPISGSTVADRRPGLAWPPAEKAEAYRVKLLSGAGRELWKAEVQGPRVAFPAEKESLQPGYVYRWEVTDPDFRKVAGGEFTVATATELAQLDELQALAGSGDRADRHSAALAFRRLGAYAEAIAAYEGLAKESPGETAYRDALAELRRIAGRPDGLEVPPGKD